MSKQETRPQRVIDWLDHLRPWEAAGGVWRHARRTTGSRFGHYTTGSVY